VSLAAALLVLAAAPERVELVFGGDVIPHDAVKDAARLHQGLDDEPLTGWTQILGPLAETFRRADLAVVNLETPLTDDKRARTAEMLFNAPSVLARALKASGVGLATFANNHCLDQHRPGIVETRRHLDEAGLLSTGADADEARAWQPLIVERGGLRLGFFAFTRFLNDFHNAADPRAPHVPLVHYDSDPASGGIDEAALLPRVRAAAAQCDALIVIPHWGDEYQPEPKRVDRLLAWKLVEAGAAAVVGHHPHVVQPMETVVRADGSEAVVAYSLGNLVSNQDSDRPRSPKRDGLLLRLVLERPAPGAPVRVQHALPMPVWTDHAGTLKRDRRVQALVLDDELAALDERLHRLEPYADKVSAAEKMVLTARRALFVERRAQVLERLPLEFHPPGFVASTSPPPVTAASQAATTAP